jgi:hypothetical protein
MQVQFEMVRMPNFIRYKFKDSKEENAPERIISVSDLSEADATEYAEAMKRAFIQHWKNKQTLPVK